jgi:transcription initiation factor TFIIB
MDDALAFAFAFSKTFETGGDLVDNGCEACLGCQSKNIVEDYANGYKVCSDCGQINESLYDKSPEWTQYEDGKASGSARCGGPTNPFLPIASLGTNMLASNTSKMKKLHNWGQMPYDERALKGVLDIIDSVCKKNNIVKAVSDCAQIMYSKLHKMRHIDGKSEGKKMIFRGKNRESIIAACVYYGANYQNQPRTTKDIAAYFNLDVKQVSKGIRHVIELMRDDNIITNIQTSSPSLYIRNFCIKKLPKDYVPIAYELANNITKLDLASNHQPNSIAAATILLLVKNCNINITKKEIICDFKISEPTLNKTLERLDKYKKVLFDNDITNMISDAISKSNDVTLDDKLKNLNLGIVENNVEPDKRRRSKKRVVVV